MSEQKGFHFETPLYAVQESVGWKICDDYGNTIARGLMKGHDFGEGHAKGVVHCVNTYESRENLIKELTEALEGAEIIIGGLSGNNMTNKALSKAQRAYDKILSVLKKHGGLIEGSLK
jgi:hypothetical protein